MIGVVKAGVAAAAAWVRLEVAGARRALLLLALRELDRRLDEDRAYRVRLLERLAELEGARLEMRE